MTLFFKVTNDHSFQRPFPSLHVPCLSAASEHCRSWFSPDLSSGHFSVFSYSFCLSPKCHNFSRFCPWSFFSQLPSLGRCFNFLSRILAPHFQLPAPYLHLNMQRAKAPNHLPYSSPTSARITISSCPQLYC